MLQGYVGNFFETGKLFVNRKTWLEAMPYRKSKKEPLCPIGTQCLSDIFEVRPKRVNLKYQQKTLQYIFSKPSHFEHPFQQTCTTTGAKPTPQSTFCFPWRKRQVATNAIPQCSLTANWYQFQVSPVPKHKFSSIWFAIAGFVEFIFRWSKSPKSTFTKQQKNHLAILCDLFGDGEKVTFNVWGSKGHLDSPKAKTHTDLMVRPRKVMSQSML